MVKRILLASIILTCLIMLNAGCDVVSPEPGIAEIKSDLIGETITQGNLTWHFHALAEFQEVTIMNKLREADTIEYNVNIKLKDIFTEKKYVANILMIYQKSGINWELFSILTMSLRMASDGQSI